MSTKTSAQPATTSDADSLPPSQSPAGPFLRERDCPECAGTGRATVTREFAPPRTQQCGDCRGTGTQVECPDDGWHASPSCPIMRTQRENRWKGETDFAIMMLKRAIERAEARERTDAVITDLHDMRIALGALERCRGRVTSYAHP